MPEETPQPASPNLTFINPLSARDMLLDMAAVAGSGLATFDLLRKVCPELAIEGNAQAAFRRIIAEVSSTRTSLEIGEFTVGDVIERLPAWLAIIPDALEMAPPIDEQGVPPSTIPGGLLVGDRSGTLVFGISLPIPPRIPPDAFPPTPPPSGLPPPLDLTPQEADILRRFLDMVERALVWLRERGISQWALRILEDLLALARQQLLDRSPELFRTITRLFAGLLRAFESAGFAEGLGFLSRWLAFLVRIFGSRLFIFLNTLGLLLLVAQVSYAAGEEIAKIKINDKETVGTWWGNRFWELVRGPCPELLDALNQAIREWRAEQAALAPSQQQANALARVIVLETEYARRCLAPGSGEKAREERYIAMLESEYRDLTTLGQPPTGVVPLPGPPAAPQSQEVCQVVVTLVSIDYGGNNIGRDWKLALGVGTSTIDVPVQDLANGSQVVLNPPLVAYKASFKPCSSFGLVPLSVEARQRHLFGDDVGNNSKLLRPSCPTDHQEKIAVWVNHESTFWQNTESALLTFTFHVEATCSAVVAP